MRKNRKSPPIHTHEGAVAQKIKPELELKRSVMACMLWEDTFYEDGVSIAERIKTLVGKVDNGAVASMAIEARENMHLRHVPLLLAVELARKGGLKAVVLEEIIQRPDELTEFLALYWENGRCPLSKQVKLGLARAFSKFGEYQLAKYNRDEAIKLRDVLFLCHAKPKDKNQDRLWKKIIEGTLQPPDTWEVALSGGEDKKTAWTRLLKEGKLGGLALIRNLRNMIKVGVDEKLVRDSIENIWATNILPFRFIAAAKYAPQYEDSIEKIMLKCLIEKPRFKGHTIVVVDCSGSMDATLSQKSEMTRFEAGAAIAIICRELCDKVTVYAYGSQEILVPARRGFALRDALRKADTGYWTDLGRCMNTVNKQEYDRVIVITDEQSGTSVPAPKGRGYVINVAVYQNGIGYGAYTHIDGFSEAVLDYIREYESSF